MITPLHHRVLIKPDPQPTETESGLALVEDFRAPDTSGTVIAKGHGPRWAQEIRRDTIRECAALVRKCYWNGSSGIIAILDRLDELLAATASLPDRDVELGDRVVFSPASGQVVQLEDGPYLLMAEDDLLAVVEPDAQTAKERAA